MAGRKIYRRAALLPVILGILFAGACGHLQKRKPASMPHAASALKVYVMVGFHVDFYHSWRGDSADDAGYGQDYKVISHTIEVLNRAQAQKRKAKAYWDFSANHWTFGEFLPKSYPDMIAKWKSRDPQDEFIVGPFNNGANAAATKDEFQKAIEWTLTNPGGYGIQQMFKNVGMFYRPQEMTLASGQGQWLREVGIQGLILQYATYSFNAFSNFVRPLSLEDRFNPIWFQSHESDEPMIVLPSMSPIDLINFVSLEKLMTDLREKQLRGEIKRNVVIHLNLDADAISWMPLVKSRALTKVVPNLGGIEEIVDAVNKYSWADFTTPSEYLKIEAPQKQVRLGQDLADGAFDGYASWAEKESTQRYWPMIERSRIIERFLDQEGFTDAKARPAWENPSFFNRLLALSTTHFGMSTPFVNYQRYLRLQRYSMDALRGKETELRNWMASQSDLNPRSEESEIVIKEFPRYGQRSFEPAPGVERISLPVRRAEGVAPRKMDYILESLNEEYDLLHVFRPIGKKHEKVALESAPLSQCAIQIGGELVGAGLKVSFSPKTGIDRLSYEGEIFGASDFLSPFIHFNKRVLRPSEYLIRSRRCGTSPHIQDVSMDAVIELKGEKRGYRLPIAYRFWVREKDPVLYMNVKANIPFTLDEDIPKSANPQFLRHVDYRWREIALSQIKPFFDASDSLRVWKMNYEGLVSSYDLNYEQINPMNLDVGSLNNHLTPGWLAVSDGKKGVLIAFNAQKRSSFAAIPLRVTSQNHRKELELNPFGSYFGRQFDYSHVGGERLGTMLANMGAQYLRPNAPGFAGEKLEYELMIAPYHGDRPSTDLISAALNFAYPAMGFLVRGDGVKTTHELADELRRIELDLGGQLVAPRSLAVSHSDRKLILTWQLEEGAHADHFEVVWKKKGQRRWQRVLVNPDLRYFEIERLENETKYEVAVRTLLHGKGSSFSNLQEVAPSTSYDNHLTDGFSLNEKIIRGFVDLIIKQQQIKNPDAAKREAH